MMDVEKQPICDAIAAGLRRPSTAFLLFIFTIVLISTRQITNNYIFPMSGKSDSDVGSGRPSDRPGCDGFYRGGSSRMTVMSIGEFGGVGDGKTSNTEAFRRAMQHMQGLTSAGGAQLNIPRGIWLTGSFNLTSNFTLFLEEGAVILGSKDPDDWPIIQPLPSYGRGRERLGGRHISLIHGNGLTNVVITGHNGTIDGQGKIWWDLWWNRTLVHTRGHLVELINSENILISNLTFLNSPFWTIHPVYCRNVVIKDMTILAPLNSPNTDGIDPDSSTHVCIQDCYIESGDDLVAIKSGWDQYGINMSLPSSNIIITRVSGTTPTCSGVGIGSEMSGGVSNITIEDLFVRDSACGVRIKTDIGRGGYIYNVTIRNITMERVKIPIRFSKGSNDHPDDGWDPKAVPKVKGILISNVTSKESKKAPLLMGIKGAPYEEVCIRDIAIMGLSPSDKWTCEFVHGSSHGVGPAPPCVQLMGNGPSSSWC